MIDDNLERRQAQVCRQSHVTEEQNLGAFFFYG